MKKHKWFGHNKIPNDNKYFIINYIGHIGFSKEEVRRTYSMLRIAYNEDGERSVLYKYKSKDGDIWVDIFKWLRREEPLTGISTPMGYFPLHGHDIRWRYATGAESAYKDLKDI